MLKRIRNEYSAGDCHIDIGAPKCEKHQLPIHVLPRELQDVIIDILHDDYVALKACCLTWRAWLPRARYHLFRSVSINRGPAGDAFARLLQTSAAISQYIQDVEINGSQYESISWDSSVRRALSWPTLGPPTRSQTETDISDVNAWLFRVLPEDEALLAKVESLRLSALPLSHALTMVLQPRFGQIKILSVDGCKALAFADFVVFLAAFPRIGSLRLLAIQWLPGSMSPGCPHPFPRLKHLQLSHKVDAAPFVHWMINENMHAEITSLSCSLSGQKCGSAVSRLLQVLGPTLAHLQIGFRETGDAADVLRKSHLELMHSTGLRTIRIDCSVIAARLSHTTSYRPSLSWIIILLSSANSTKLKQIVFSICASDLCILNMEGLDVVLSHPRYESLECVVFEINYQTDPAETIHVTHISMRMAAAKRRGLLQFIALGRRCI